MTGPWLVVWALGVAACGTSPSTGTCPADQPSSCPSAIPSYATDIAPLIETYCTSQCHNATGVASDQPLGTYPELKSRSVNAQTQIYQCRMPKPPVDPPTEEERVAILSWFVCGAPDN